MKTHRRLWALLLALVIACTTMTTTLLAANGERYSISSAQTHNQEVQQLQQSLQDKYAINITYPSYDSGGVSVAGIQPETLRTLDKALEYVSPEFVRKVSAYYQQTTGRRLQYSYTYGNLSGPYGFGGSDEVTVGLFDPQRATVELYIPRPGNGATISGDAPITVLHELGHAAYVMIADQYGESTLRGNWTSFNGSYNYHSSNLVQNPSNTVFISAYAATMFEEDFAEVFAHAFVRNRAGMGFTNLLGTAEEPTGLRKKINYMYQLLDTYYADCPTLLQNYRNLFNIPVSMSYKGLTFSGEHLQFMGYGEARYLPLTALNTFGATESQYTWVSELGAWTAWDSSSGQYLVVFPDGTWGNTSTNILAA